VRLPATFLSGLIAIGMAWLGMGVWALIGQMLSMAFFGAVFLWYVQRWSPGWRFDIAALKDMYHFGYKLYLSATLDTIFRNIYVIVIAKIFSASAAGLYFFADKIKELIVFQIVLAIQDVTYPALSSIQDDSMRMKSAYKKVMTVTTYLLFPIFLFLAAIADPLFQLVLPAKWHPAAPYLQLMCLASVLYPAHAINLNILKVKKRSDLFLYLEIIKIIILTIVLVVSIPFGVYGILIGQILCSILFYIPNSYYSKKLADYSMMEQILDFVPALLLSASLATAGYAISSTLLNDAPFLTLVLVGGGMGLAYLILSWLFKLTAMQLAADIVREKIKRKNI
jgi:O-antigen/teichoic acid export membrane protein